MNEKTKLGLGIIETALLLGILGDALLRATPWGINVFLLATAFAAGAHALSHWRGARNAGEARWLWPVMLVFAAFFAWRDSGALKFLDSLTIAATLALLALATRGVRLQAVGVFDYVLAVCVSAANAIFGVFPLVFSDVKWKEIPQTGWSKHALAAARGLLIALPLLLVFGALFVAADAVFEGFVNRTLNFDAELAFTHVLLFAFFAWMTGGFLRGMFLAEQPITSFNGLASRISHPAPQTINSQKPAHENAANEKTDAQRAEDAAHNAPHAAPAHARRSVTDEPAGDAPHGGYRFSAGEDEKPASHNQVEPEFSSADETKTTQQEATVSARQPQTEVGRGRISLGIVEIGIVIGLLDLLFFSFVLVQLQYFFGDAEHVVASAGLTFSDYARRGFFELVWVVVLALPMLLAAHWLLRKENPLHEKIFRALAGAMTAMLFVIMASGLWRMRLYQSAYGQTELRFYTTAFMIWLGAVLVWFALTVLRGRRELFAVGALVTWLFVLGALHFVNPGYRIAQANIEHARANGQFDRFDAAYTVSLGPDAAPALLGALPEMKQRDQYHTASRLVAWLDEDRKTDWRSWNYSRARAHKLLTENEAVLRDWDARWQNTLKAEHETAQRARQSAQSSTPLSPQAVMSVSGTPLFIRIERSAGAGYRTVTLTFGETIVSMLTMPADDGQRTRIDVLRISPETILLQDAYGTYTVDTKRRSLSKSDAVKAANAAFIGAFDLDDKRVWRFIPASEFKQAKGSVQGKVISTSISKTDR